VGRPLRFGCENLRCRRGWVYSDHQMITPSFLVCEENVLLELPDEAGLPVAPGEVAE
jgi:hypothetical protein